MFDDYTICPYPGLRPFTEEESIYFKGRDKNIDEIVEVLQQNKFLMVTGASGDGKSSLIYAGLIPNARAGFFKSKYNRWEIAHFRPERTPLRNCARAIKEAFGKEEGSVLTELSRGYRSLIDLYLSSDLHLDETSNKFREADEDGKSEQKRKAANLLLVVDQFEEFFTNQENFQDNVPSEAAQVLVGALLETARVAIDEDLPVYIVFTMRSDYIGQCAAFRGLPEFIGFSQFFVPRLKRKDLQNVIEEPAELNGNHISRRLVERLLFDMNEGLDQLPILQHTLNQIWHAAKDGQEEMDLIHYAMVGGMSEEELPEEQIEEFNNWKQGLPQWKIDHFTNPGFHRVLDLHADDLYEGTWESLKDKDKISRHDTKVIIALTFACLTKIDNSRAVRNQMTLQEITNIINIPNVTVDVVNEVIRKYREEGNTFIRPFVLEDDPSTVNLEPNQVLDITHESLIRNWDRLKGWAEKEFEYYEIYVDFKQQLDKWIGSNESRGYLLPIGPLTYYENWYEECNPNPYWINRYSENSDIDSIKESEEILDDSKRFLSKSASKHIITRTFLKYGSLRVAAVLSVIIVIFLSGFYFFDADKKINSQVLQQVRENGRPLLNSFETQNLAKGFYILLMERVFAGSTFDELLEIESPKMRAEVANSVYNGVFYFDNNFSPPGKSPYLNFLDSLINNGGLEAEDQLEMQSWFVDILGYDYYFNKEPFVYKLLQENLERSSNLIEEVIDNRKVEDILILNFAIDNVVNWSDDAEAPIDRILKKISPFAENSPFEESSLDVFNRYYPRREAIQNGRAGNITHKGGYQKVATLFAAKGDLEHASMAFDTLVKYNGNYFDFNAFNNWANILTNFIRFGHQEEALEFMNLVANRSGKTRFDLYNRYLDRTIEINYLYQRMRVFEYTSYNPNGSLLKPEHVDFILESMYNDISKEFSGNDLDYHLAIYYKHKGILTYRINTADSIEVDKNEIFKTFDLALEHYNNLSQDYLDVEVQNIYRYWQDGIRFGNFTRDYYMKYPDHFYGVVWHSDKYSTNIFLEYLLRRGLLLEYFGDEDLYVVNDWLANHYEVYPFQFSGSNIWRNVEPLEMDHLIEVYDLISNSDPSSFDDTYLKLLLGNHYFDQGDQTTAMQFAGSIDLESLMPLANNWDYLNYTAIMNDVFALMKNLSKMGMHESVFDIIEILPDDNYKATAYSVLADELFKGENKEMAFYYLDSAYSKKSNIDISKMNAFANVDFRFWMIPTLSGIGGTKLSNEAKDMFVEMAPGAKAGALGSYIQGIARSGYYYKALSEIPEDITENNELFFYGNILTEEVQRIPSREGWEALNEGWEYWFSEFILFRDNTGN